MVSTRLFKSFNHSRTIWIQLLVLVCLLCMVTPGEPYKYYGVGNNKNTAAAPGSAAFYTGMVKNDNQRDYTGFGFEKQQSPAVKKPLSTMQKIKRAVSIRH